LFSWFFAALKTLITPSRKTAAKAFTSPKLQIQTPSLIPKQSISLGIAFETMTAISAPLLLMSVFSFSIQSFEKFVVRLLS
jgi:hypothetical protein